MLAQRNLCSSHLFSFYFHKSYISASSCPNWRTIWIEETSRALQAIGRTAVTWWSSKLLGNPMIVATF